MSIRQHLFTSESVTVGHPDKVCDQISDAILDASLKQDTDSRVACEVLVSSGTVIVAGEITTKAQLDIGEIVRDTVKSIGYTDPSLGFDYMSLSVLNLLKEQSPDISQGVSEGEGMHKEQGAGDQGMMFGYACNETRELMPLSLHLAHLITDRLREARENEEVDWLKSDGKSQVTVEYDEKGKPYRIHTVVVSTQHSAKIDYEEMKEWVFANVVKKSISSDLIDDKTIFHVNPTGRFVTGGPKGDCGVTGRKIIVDTYGGRGSHGGGAFSGKDPSKVDRSAAYMARYIAKNIVASGLADICELQLSYAIGVAQPVSVFIDTKKTGTISDREIEQIVYRVFPLTPKRIIEHLDLKRPIYLETAKNGHFGKNHLDFTWEKTDMIEKIEKEVEKIKYDR